MIKSEEAKERARLRAAEWYKNNPERANASKRALYRKHKERWLGYAATKRCSRRQVIWEYKVERGCAICGYKEHHAALDFHHLDECEKVGNISQIYQGKWEAVLAEIEKCQILCANCHRIISHEKSIERRSKKKAAKEQRDQQLRLHLA